jgi:hypothetical protein
MFGKFTRADGHWAGWLYATDDVQASASSEIDVTSVKYDKEAPAKLFDRSNLPNAAADKFWKSAM